MKAFLFLLLGMLRDFVTSKKVLTAVLTSVAGALIKNPEIRDRVVAIGLALLGGQALTDVGKAKAAIAATAAPPALPAIAQAPAPAIVSGPGMIPPHPFVSGFTVSPAPPGSPAGTVTATLTTSSTPPGPTP